MSSRESRAVIHGSAHRRRQSRERPPYMSDLRIVLLGKSVSENSGVGNFILGRAAFDSEAPPDVVERVGGRLKDRHVIIINSPQLLQTNISDHQITQTVRECVNLSDPGPHVIILILNHEQCSTEDQEFVEKVLHSFSEQVNQHTIVITTQEPTETKEILQKIIQKCAKRHFSLQRSSSPHDLLQTFEDIVQLNDGRHLVCAEHEASQDFTMKQQAIGRLSEGVKLNLNLVVCGSDGTLKSFVSKRILQQTDRRSDVKLHGRQISLVELPALIQLSEEEVMRQTLHCVSLCHPGVHVFLLILPDAPLTDEDKAEMEIIQRIFSSKIKKHIMILIINEKNMIGKVNLINCSSSEMSIQSFGGRRFVLENSSQVPDLLQDVENMVRENQGSYYTTFMYLQARVELERNKHRAEIEELRRSMMKTQSTADVTHDDLRIVLLGKVGVGKSATRNAILRKKAFKSTIKSSLLTRECQKETSEFNRREITVIDTPGLFDTGVDNVKTRKEIVKCISMAAPGPHVFLLVIQLGRFTQEEKDAVKMIQEMFGDQSRMYTMVLFTTGDDLDPQGTTIEEIIEANDNLQYLIMQCGKRYHVFKNNETEDQTQVSELLDKIDCMVAANGGSFYTSEMIQQVDKNIREEQDRIMKEKEEENKRKEEELRAKYEAEIEQMKKENERERQEMQNELRKKGEEFKKREEEIKKETNENLQKELQRKLEELKQFEEESKRKEKALGEQQQNFIKHMEEKYEKKKQNLHEKIQHDTREQAELKYLTQLEREVDKALQTYNTENTESLHEQEKQDCDYSFYTSEMFQQEEKTIRERQERIIKEKEEEIKRREEELRAKYEEEIEVKKENERQRQEMQNELRKIAEEFKKREKQIKKRTDENVRKERQRKPEEEQKLFEEQKENRKKNLIEKHQESILFETRKTSNEEVEKLAKCIQELGNSLDRDCSFASLLEQHRGQRRYRGFIEATAESFVDSFLNIVNWIIGSHSKRETQKQTEV